MRQWEENGEFAPAEAGDVRRLVLKKAGAVADRIRLGDSRSNCARAPGIPTRITRPLATPMMASAATAADEDASSDLVKWLRRQLSIGGH